MPPETIQKELQLCLTACLIGVVSGSCTASRPSNDAAEMPSSEGSVSRGGAAESPDGEHHPGQIEYDDKIGGQTYFRLAESVPQSVGWVWVTDRWEPVLRIEVTGTTTQRRITRFGRGGVFLDATVQAPLVLPEEPASPTMPTPTP